MYGRLVYAHAMGRNDCGFEEIKQSGLLEPHEEAQFVNAKGACTHTFDDCELVVCSSPDHVITL